MIRAFTTTLNRLWLILSVILCRPLFSLWRVKQVAIKERKGYSSVPIQSHVNSKLYFCVCLCNLFFFSFTQVLVSNLVIQNKENTEFRYLFTVSTVFGILCFNGIYFWWPFFRPVLSILCWSWIYFHMCFYSHKVSKIFFKFLNRNIIVDITFT